MKTVTTMDTAQARRLELGEFLRAQRARLTPVMQTGKRSMTKPGLTPVPMTRAPDLLQILSRSAASRGSRLSCAASSKLSLCGLKTPGIGNSLTALRIYLFRAEDKP